MMALKRLAGVLRFSIALKSTWYLLTGPLTRFQTHHPSALLVLVLRSELALHGACLVSPGSSSQAPNPWEWPPGQGWRSHRAAAPGRAGLRRWPRAGQPGARKTADRKST